MPPADAPRPIVLQRIRDRIIEHLELVAPAAHDPPQLKTADLVNLWEDWVPMPTPELSTPPFSGVEVEVVEQFAREWESFCVATPEWPDHYAELFAHPAWPAFRDGASRALAALTERGRLSEDTVDEPPLEDR